MQQDPRIVSLTTDIERSKFEQLIVRLFRELRGRIPDRIDSSLPELESEARSLGIDPYLKK